MSAPVDYKDRLLILVSIPFISALNYYLTYSNIQWGGFLWLTYTLDTLEGYVAWYAARWVILRFDRTMPWENNLKKRLVLQLPVVAAVILVALILQTELVNYIARDKPLPIEFYTEDVFIFLIWALFINFIYLALYFLRRYQQVKSEPLQKKPAVHSALLVKAGRTQKRIPFEQISLFFVANDLVYAVTTEGKIPAAGYTLDKIEKMTDSHLFFRANRQVILTRSVIDYIKKGENGKLAVFVKGDVENPVMMSRLRTPAFRKWLED